MAVFDPNTFSLSSKVLVCIRIRIGFGFGFSNNLDPVSDKWLDPDLVPVNPDPNER
jgi:hypothetical protein